MRDFPCFPRARAHVGVALGATGLGGDGRRGVQLLSGRRHAGHRRRLVGIGFPENLAVALEQRFLGHAESRACRWCMPRAGRRQDARFEPPGPPGAGLARHRRALGLVPALQRLAVSRRIEAWNLPQG